MNTAFHPKDSISSSSVPSGIQDQVDEAKIYLEKHKIQWAFEQITQALIYERPSNPNEFIIRKLELIKSSRVYSTFLKNEFIPFDTLGAWSSLHQFYKGQYHFSL